MDAAWIGTHGDRPADDGQVLLDAWLHTQARQMVTGLLNGLMEAERDALIGCGTYERSSRRRGYRNGYEQRWLDTGFGRLDLRQPRVRGTDRPFRTVVMRTYQRRSTEVDRSVRRWVAGGLSTRATAAEVTRTFGAILSATTVSRIVADVDGAIRAFHRRPLGPRRYRYLFLDGKHVFIEKPFTTSVRQADELIELADKQGLVMMVGHVFEYSPAVTKIKEVISGGELGDVYYISSTRVNLGIHQKDVSVVWDLAHHDLSMFLHWLGEGPIRVSATGKAYVQKGIMDVAFISMEFASGAIGHIQVSWLSPSKEVTTNTTSPTLRRLSPIHLASLLFI